MTEALRKTHNPIAPRSMAEAIRGPRRAGALVILGFLGGFGVWTATAPLAGGAVAPGQISPDRGVRTIEHLEGGLVREIHAREGDRVRAGDVLISIDVTSTQAEADALADRRLTRLAEQARIAAESAGAKTLAPPPELDPEVAGEVIAAERRTLEARRALHEARVRVLDQRVGQLDETVAGHLLQAASAAEQIGLMREELDDKSTLLGRGLAAKAEVLRLRRLIAETEGLRGSHLTAIAEARQEIGEIELDMKARNAEDAEQLARRAAEVRNELAEIDKQLSALDAVLARQVLIAPVDGIVSNLRARNAGAILKPGAPVLDIVPEREQLLIDARVAPNDIDAVSLGMPAQIRISAYSGRTMPRIEGRVSLVSADSSRGENGATSYYPIRVEVDPGELAGTDIEIRSGMLVEVLVVTRERPVLSYLLEPFQSLLGKAMREV